MTTPATPGPGAFLNRELSWLAFNDRVLEEGLDPATPLLERLKFLGIVSSNLDEFFMIRVAGLERQVAAGRDDPAPPDDARPSEVLAEIARKTAAMLERQYRVLHKEILRPCAQASAFLRSASRPASERRRPALDGGFPF